MNQGRINNERYGYQKISCADARYQEYCSSGFQGGLTAFTRDHERVNRSLERVGNAKRHPDNRNQGGGDDHAEDQSNSARIRRQFLAQEIGQPGQQAIPPEYWE